MVMRATKRPKILVFDDYRTISRRVALKISNLIKADRTAPEKRKTVLGLATGSSPLGVYRELTKMYRSGDVDFSDCVFFNLDEYYGISRKDLQSYYRFMKENFFEYVNVREEQINIPDGTLTEEALRTFCQEYEAKIRGLGGIDLQLLGIGRDGHIGFNEPVASPDSRTRLVELSDITRKDAAPDFFGLRNVPTKAVTMGVGTILETREIILLVSGEHKAKTLQRAFEGPPSGDSPASFLQYHENVEVLSDKAAASMMIEHSAPWVVRDDINWRIDKLNANAAAIWLALRKKKKLSELSGEDFHSDHLGSIVSSLGSSFGKESLREFNAKVGALGILISPLNRSPSHKAKILIFSPHPDDDVICMGATMKKMTGAGYNVDVAYMVSGANAVKDLDVLNYLELEDNEVSNLVDHYATSHSLDHVSAKRTIIKSIYQKSKGALDEPIVRMIKREIRRQEAFRASQRAGAKAHFLNLPFYEEYGSARKAPISEEDVELVRRLLFDVSPDAIFVAGDTTDPNGTHAMCLDAFQEAFSSLKDFAKSEEEKKFSSENNVRIFQYRGAWQEFTLEDADALEPFTDSLLEEKIEMILEHVSQLDPLFPGPDDDRQFWERAKERNVKFLNLCVSLGLGITGAGAEVYKKYA